ncbi:MAG: cytochrome C oxidase subunit IV family protein [Pseudomonadota bacterium]|nr:cytochrome C oxidase subunit IV family protein [Pseudomonadota bacterium]
MMDARTHTETTAAKSIDRLVRPCTRVWLALVGLTVAMLVAGEMGLSGGSVVTLLLIATLIKTRLVADRFMGLRHSRLLWRMIVMVYLVGVIGLIGLAWWLGNI